MGNKTVINRKCSQITDYNSNLINRDINLNKWNINEYKMKIKMIQNMIILKY